MRDSPFLDDPRDAAIRHVKAAVETPMEQVAAIHLEQALHHAAIARDSGLLPKARPADPNAPPRPAAAGRSTSRTGRGQ